MKPKRIKLKDYAIKTKIIIEEWHEKYKEGSLYEQPFASYSVIIDKSPLRTSTGGMTTKKQVLKFIGENI